MKIRLKPISEQVVALVGATSGIGLETAMYMAGKGARIAIVGRSQEGLNDALTQVRNHAENTRAMRMRGRNGHSQEQTNYASQGGLESVESGGAPVTTMDDQVIALEGDVTNFDQMKSVAEQIIARFGRIDTWVNVAAVSEWALFEDTNPDEFRRIIEVNLLGQAFGAMAVLPYLKQQNGSALIFVSSVAGRVPIPYQSAYNASKHGILGLADTLRQEFRHTGVPVSVTAILPASIDTPLFEKARTKLGVEPEPIKPVYDVRLVARAITHAATHPVNELIVGDAGYMMTFMRRLAPTLTSNLMGASGFRQQRSNEAKSAQAPANMYHHIAGHNETEGESARGAMQISPLTWLSTHPRVRMAIYGTLMGSAGALIGWQIVRARRKRMGWRYQLPRRAKKISRDATKFAAKTSRDAAKFAAKASKQASKTASRSLNDAGKTMITLPVISSMPMFRKKSFLEKAADMALGWWAAVTALQLPFRRKKSVIQRVSDAMPAITLASAMDRLPMRRKASMVDRITMADQRKAVMKMATKQANRASKLVKKQTAETTAVLDKQSKRAAKKSAKAAMKLDKQGKRAAKRVERAADRFDDARKDALKTASKVADRAANSKTNLKEMADNMTTPVVVRRQTFVERLPFGTRKETVVERVPVKK